MKTTLIAAALTLCISSAWAVTPGTSGQSNMRQSVGQVKAQLTTAERSQFAAQIARRFAAEVQANGGSVQAWSKNLGRMIGVVDAAQVQYAAQMPTLNTAMAVLQGQPVTSPSIQNTLKDIQQGRITPTALGDPTADTVYTPLPNGRCRVADSREINLPLPGGENRSIDVSDVSTYAAQGGHGSSAGDGSTNCGIPVGVTAYAVTVTVVTTGQEGFFKIFRNGDAYTTGNTAYYMPAVSASNDVIVKSCLTCAADLEIYSNSQVHYVLDVVGYFAPPVASALACQSTAPVEVTVAGNALGNSQAAFCPPGTTRVATDCESTSTSMPLLSDANGVCSAKNNGTTAGTLRATNTCCKLPGR